MLVRCTKKLLDQLNMKPELMVEEEPLFSWHANLLTVNRRKTVALVNDNNRYVIVLYGLKANDFKKLDELIIKAIRETLKDECIKDEIIERFLNRSGKIVYTKTKDKTSVARMNKSCENIYIFGDSLSFDNIFQSDISMKVGHFLVGDGKNNYIHPNEELYKDLKAFSGHSIFSCKAVEIKVNLELEKYNVWRRLVVPLNITFTKLHKVLQAAFGWKDYHLHEFFILENEVSDNDYSNKVSVNHPAYNKEGYKPVVNLVCSDDAFDYPNDIPMKLEENIRLNEYIPKYRRMKYNYDFGDNWQHYIEVEKIIEDFDLNYPVCIEGEGNTPPEDVGGETGYDDFLEIISNEKHPEYRVMLEWGKSQGYKDFDLEKINRKIKFIL